MVLESNSLKGEIRRVLRFARQTFLRLSRYKSYLEATGYWWYRWHPDVGIGLDEEWERPLQRYLLRPNACLVDAGAHIGRWTIRASPFNRLILAFEPDSTTNEVLRRNLARNGIRNVLVFDFALSNHRADAVLLDYGPPACSSLRNAHVSGRKSKDGKLVRVRKLDDFADNFSLPMILKIDVEGAELSVLEGSSNTLEKFKPTIVMEVHFRNELGSISEELWRHNYIIVSMFTERTKPKGQVYFVADHRNRGMAKSHPKAHERTAGSARGSILVMRESFDDF